MTPELKFNVSPILQANNKCCWLACYQMLYQWKNRSVGEVVNRISAAKISTTVGLDISDWGKARLALGLTSYRVNYLRNFDNFHKTLSDHGPMWCGGNFLNGDPHAILIVGVQPQGQRLRYLDPYKLWQNGGTGFEYTSHSQWCGLIKSADFAAQMWF